MQQPIADRKNPPYEVFILTIFVVAAFATLAVIMSGGGHHDASVLAGTTPYGPEDLADVRWDEPLPSAEEGHVGKAEFPVPPPPFSDEDIFPCSECHEELETNPARRKLEMAHGEIVLAHGPQDRWCLDCHNPDDRDKLRLVNGELIGFDESFKLCGQCHGTIYRDWRAGIHGRRRGNWDGKKSYLLCAHCHDPHAPKYKPMKPMPPPVRPQFIDPALREGKGTAEHED